MILKSILGTLKALDETGKGQCVFSTLNVIDKDGDLTMPGAFGEQVVKFCGAHDWKAPNFGMAKISEVGENAVADFELYLDMAAAQEWHKSLKNNFEKGVPQEWSYGFDVLEEAFEQRDNQRVRVLKRVKVHEISPVMIGAGMGTRTTGVKELGEATLEELFVKLESGISELKEGRVLSSANRTRLNTLLEAIGQARTDIEKLLADTDPEKDGKEAANLYARFLRTTAQIDGHIRR